MKWQCFFETFWADGKQNHIVARGQAARFITKLFALGEEELGGNPSIVEHAGPDGSLTIIVWYFTKSKVER